MARAPFPARFDGFCMRCQESIDSGEQIVGTDNDGYVHEECGDDD
jgi:hypothetical protein